MRAAECSLLGRVQRHLLAADLAQNDRLFEGALDSFSMDKRYRHRDGRTLHVHLAVALVRDEEGRPRHSIAQVIDMTRREGNGRTMHYQHVARR